MNATIGIGGVNESKQHFTILHTGDLCGAPSHILAALSSLLLAVMVIGSELVPKTGNLIRLVNAIRRVIGRYFRLARCKKVVQFCQCEPVFDQGSEERILIPHRNIILLFAGKVHRITSCLTSTGGHNSFQSSPDRFLEARSAFQRGTSR